ncbi:unnamed protein product [Mucor hiemalis]
MITSSNQQSNYHQRPISPLFSNFSDSSNTYNQRNHRSTIATETAAVAAVSTPILFHYNSYYNSPSNSPLPSPHILNHHHIPPYYPQSSLMDSSSYSPHLQQSPSPPISCLSVPGGNHNNHRGLSSNNIIRYDISLEAPTAASQRVDESPLTYLNKGQYYNITLRDNERFDGDIYSVVSINFHDESHRSGATDYWKFWLTQQKDADKARAVEIDLTRSNGAQMMECRQFDRITFKWNGKLGASVHIRFNCLSTDFSRIKGVKGIPLRLQIKSSESMHPQQPFECTYCRIKLFRDKGAERKNKDDAKHIERQLEKLRGKSGEPHPLWLAFSPTAPVTLFREVVPIDEDDETNSQQFHQLSMEDPRLSMSHYGGDTSSGMLLSNASNSNILLPPPTTMKRTFSGYQPEINHTYNPGGVVAGTPNALSIVPPPIGIDPSYIPQRRRRIAKLSLLVKFGSCEVYRAIYLEHLTVKELTEKLSQRMDIQKPVSNVLRKVASKDRNKPDMIVEVNDEVIQDMHEEQDIYIETRSDDDDESNGTITLILHF